MSHNLLVRIANLASENEKLRPHLMPLIREAADTEDKEKVKKLFQQKGLEYRRAMRQEDWKKAEAIMDWANKEVKKHPPEWRNTLDQLISGYGPAARKPENQKAWGIDPPPKKAHEVLAVDRPGPVLSIAGKKYRVIRYAPTDKNLPGNLRPTSQTATGKIQALTKDGKLKGTAKDVIFYEKGKLGIAGPRRSYITTEYKDLGDDMGKTAAAGTVTVYTVVYDGEGSGPAGDGTFVRRFRDKSKADAFAKANTLYGRPTTAQKDDAPKALARRWGLI